MLMIFILLSVADWHANPIRRNPSKQGFGETIVSKKRANFRVPRAGPQSYDARWLYVGGEREMTEDLSPEGEAIAAYGAATMAAFKVLVICLQTNGALEHGQFPEALRLFIHAASTDGTTEPVLDILRDLRVSLLD
jgi:hypothetical protein